MKEDVAVEGLPIMLSKDLSLHYGDFHAVKGATIPVYPQTVTAVIGPSGCGKSSYLRCFNRMNDYIKNVKIDGTIYLHDQDIYDASVDPVSLRRKIGMVFQKPNPFPKSIYQNIAWAPTINGMSDRMDERVEKALTKAALWDEVKDKLHQSGLSLSGGQQQRLCIARTIAMEPEVILMDEPCSALDPISTGRIEDLIFELKKKYSIMIVTHNMQQAARISDFTVFMYQGDVIEYGPTDRIFTRPEKKQTEDYVRGKFG
ncbi:MAG: phosphate ABC transporter ATP-binding protein PstB [Bdellovibrionota bacterium]|nr:phosphate ABC transporter ATP-binding protein [Deltaproteobacteria bacterium]